MQGHACKKAYAPKKGDKICMAGFAGCAGTLKALILKNDILKERFSPFWLEKAKKAMITDDDDIFGAVSAQEAFMQRKEDMLRYQRDIEAMNNLKPNA